VLAVRQTKIKKRIAPKPGTPSLQGFQILIRLLLMLEVVVSMQIEVLDPDLLKEIDLLLLPK
jgi:hypothetical protein